MRVGNLLGGGEPATAKVAAYTGGCLQALVCILIGVASRGPYSHSYTALYISVVILYRQDTEVRDNDFMARG